MCFAVYIPGWGMFLLRGHLKQPAYLQHCVSTMYDFSVSSFSSPDVSNDCGYFFLLFLINMYCEPSSELPYRGNSDAGTQHFLMQT